MGVRRKVYLITEGRIKTPCYKAPSHKKIYVFNESNELIKEYLSFNDFSKIYTGDIYIHRAKLLSLIRTEELFNGEYFSYNPYLKGYGNIL